MVQKQAQQLKNKRDWLNTDKAMTGFISIDVDISNPRDNKSIKRWGKKVAEHIYLSLGDCYRKITLDFPTGRHAVTDILDEKECAHSIKKAKLIRSYIDDIITELEKDV